MVMMSMMVVDACCRCGGETAAALASAPSHSFIGSFTQRPQMICSSHHSAPASASRRSSGLDGGWSCRASRCIANALPGPAHSNLPGQSEIHMLKQLTPDIQPRCPAQINPMETLPTILEEAATAHIDRNMWNAPSTNLSWVKQGGSCVTHPSYRI